MKSVTENVADAEAFANKVWNQTPLDVPLSVKRIVLVMLTRAYLKGMADQVDEYHAAQLAAITKQGNVS